MESTLTVIAIMRGEVDGDAIDIAFVEDPAVEDQDAASVLHDLRGWIAFAEGRFKEASEAWLVMANMSALNAPYVLPRAAYAAMLAGDRATRDAGARAARCHRSARSCLEVDRTAIRAGLAALDGRDRGGRRRVSGGTGRLAGARPALG